MVGIGIEGGGALTTRHTGRKEEKGAEGEGEGEAERGGGRARLRLGRAPAALALSAPPPRTAPLHRRREARHRCPQGRPQSPRCRLQHRVPQLHADKCE